jgi:hypothetical protein
VRGVDNHLLYRCTCCPLFEVVHPHELLL